MARSPVETIRREQIVAATLAVIARTGCDAATLRAIATEAGATTGMVTYHFASKAQLLSAALAEIAARFTARIDAAIAPDAGPLERLLALADACVPAGPDAEEQQALWAELWARAARDRALRAEHEALYAGWRRRIARCVRDAQAAGAVRSDVDPATWAAAFAALLDGLALHVVLQRGALGPDAMRRAARGHVAGTLQGG